MSGWLIVVACIALVMTFGGGCICCACAHCVDGDVTVQVSFTLANDQCTGGTDCEAVDGTYVLMQVAKAAPPGTADTLTETTADGLACRWEGESTAMACETTECAALNTDASCPDNTLNCDPLDQESCYGDDCTCPADFAPCQSVLACAVASVVVDEPEEERCECVETSPGSAVFVCECSAHCVADYACIAVVRVVIYLYSADANTKRVLYLTYDSEGETYHGFKVYDTNTLNCTESIANESIAITHVSTPGADPKLCTVPTTITVNFL
jgi:hypothetical protein